jgi:hypothetical protein
MKLFGGKSDESSIQEKLIKVGIMLWSIIALIRLIGGYRNYIRRRALLCNH